MLKKYALFKAMKRILLNPGNKYSIRELARETGLSPSASKVSVDYMHNLGMVKLGKVGRSAQVEADLASPLTRQWKVLFSLEELERAEVKNRILEELEGVSSILLYGSAALGVDDEKSDFDILIITSSGKLSPRVFEKLKREANAIVYKHSEWRTKAVKDKVFYERVILDSVVLYGNKPVVI